MTAKKILLLGLVSGLSVIAYLFASQQFYGIGMPLDDSWIHLTYARNLGLYGQWAFAIGEPSAGATAPLWVALIAPAYLFNVDPLLWTFILGWLCLWAVATLGGILFTQLLSQHSKISLWISVVIALEWHLVWAAVSGMETLLFSVFVLAEFVLMFRIFSKQVSSSVKNYLTLGLLIGTSAWVRPEGIIVIGIFAVGVLISNKQRSFFELVREFIPAALSFSFVFGLYLLFNQLIAGDWWPNTFHAKQAEYAILREAPIIARFLQQSTQLFVGVGVILIPGIVIYIYNNLRNKGWVPFLPIAWILAHIGLYAWRLPVTYQHGRYLIPAMPIYFVLGLVGLVRWIDPNTESVLKRVISRGWALSVVMILAVFWIQGASAYANDVAVIESEMVAAAKWSGENLNSGALVAAHDIGALGYFTDFRILDLAGLVSPDVIPFIRDESLLSIYLQEKEANYLIVFPGFYPSLTLDLDVIYVTGGEYSPSLGGENINIYELE